MLKRIRKTKLKTNPRFPGIAFLPDPSSPSSEASFFDDLIQIQSRPLGADLLADIARARPKVRSVTEGSPEEKAIQFSKPINVIARRTRINFVQSGYKLEYGDGNDRDPTGLIADPRRGIPNRRVYRTGLGCYAKAGDSDAADNGTRSVSLIYYSNAQLFTGQGEDTFSFVVLAHELIHALNHVQGTRLRDGGAEELRTTGLNQYANERYSENAFRQAFLLPGRNAY